MLKLYKEEHNIMQKNILAKQVSKKNILFVEDEESLIKVAEQVLTRKGYNVTVATRSKEAIKLVEAMPDKFDLIITDLKMAEITGLELGKMIKRGHPEIPVILSTGLISVDYADMAEAGIAGILKKPYTLSELLNIVDKVIGEQESKN